MFLCYRVRSPLVVVYRSIWDTQTRGRNSKLPPPFRKTLHRWDYLSLQSFWHFSIYMCYNLRNWHFLYIAEKIICILFLSFFYWGGGTTNFWYMKNLHNYVLFGKKHIKVIESLTNKSIEYFPLGSRADPQCS